MARRDISIPFGPDKTGGIPLDALPTEGEEPHNDPFGDPVDAPPSSSLSSSLPNPSENPMPSYGQEQAHDVDYRVPVQVSVSDIAQEPSDTAPAASSAAAQDEGPAQSSLREGGHAEPSGSAGPADVEYNPGGLTEEEATAQGMDDIQLSILALKDSIGQGRELKEREKERKELAEALEADHIELADREDILANYHTIVAEQDAIIDECTQKREAAKNELSQLTVSLEQTQAQLEALREEQAQQLQPIESDLGRARAAADQAKNDERSRKSEMSAAESELRKANDADGNMMEVARYQQVQNAYDEARARSEQAKERLAEVQKAYDEAKQRAEQAQGPLERNIADLNKRMESLKESISSLGEELSAARNRRQYCDTVYQYPNETALMRSEIEQAEALARQMDAENDMLREQLAQSKKKAFKAKVAIAIVIVIIIVIIVAFIVVSGR